MNIVQKNKLFSIVFFVTLVFNSYGQTNTKFKVALDAGHGAHDFGAVYNGHIEKNITLAIVLKVGKILEANSNLDVIYTRKTDVFIELVERSNIANKADANIFVSIHCNANKNTAAEGTETYVMGLNKNASNLAVAKSENAVITLEKDYKQKYEGFDPNNPSTMIGMTLMQEEYLDNSITLASKIQDQFTSAMKSRSRGVKQAPFMVLHKAYMPRVLIETGFISNPREGLFLDSDEGQDLVAEAIANAIVSYKKEYFGIGIYDNSEKPSKKVVKESPVINTPVKVEEKIVAPKTEMTKSSSGLVFKVQIAAVSRKIDTSPSNFKGLKNVSVSTDNGSFYRYTYEEAPDYATAKINLEVAKSKGFDSAYITAFKDGKKISIQEALK